LHTAERTDLPVFLINSDQQRGYTFGQKLSYAIEDVMSYGFDHVITIGNDTSGLNTKDLLKASQKVQQGEMVLGPSQDGGIYLLGLSKSQFDQGAISTIRWESGEVWSDLKGYACKRKSLVTELSLKRDLDTANDLHFFFRLGGSKTLLGRFISFLHSSKVSISETIQCQLTQSGRSNIGLRAPPIV